MAEQVQCSIIVFHIAKLSQAPATAELSLALFPNYPATRPGRPDRNSFFLAISQPVLNAIQPQSN